MTLTLPDPVVPPAGNAARFGGRWRLIGAGLSNIWRYADLELPAPSGRLLLRGPNGTGKTTALEVLWPYLLDLNSALLAAGKARNTHLSGLMKEGADGRRRVGYLWMSFAGPGDDEPVVSYGVRLNFSEGSTPPVKTTPFVVPGRPLHELSLWATNRDALRLEDFTGAVVAAGGTVFETDDHYVRDLATRIFATEPRQLSQLAARVRQVRNPALLGEVSPRAAADALRESLPGVSDDVIDATGEALAESEATRAAFEQDRDAAAALVEFARVWSGHAVEVATTLRAAADDAAGAVRRLTREHRRLVDDHADAVADAGKALDHEGQVTGEVEEMRHRLGAIERSDEYRAAGRLRDLATSASQRDAAAHTQWESLERTAAHGASSTGDDVAKAADLVEDLRSVLDKVAPLEPAALAPLPLSWVVHPRAPLAVGARAVDPGPSLHATFDEAALDAALAAVAARADALTSEAARAKVFAADHATVVVAETNAASAEAKASRRAETAEEKGLATKERSLAARTEASEVGARLGNWLSAESLDVDWSGDDVDAVDWGDPAAALHAADGFAEATSAWAHDRAATARARAGELDVAAQAAKADAAARRAEAQYLRANDVLLPLPRPEWAGEGDDSVAFAAAVDWAPGVDRDTQDRVEATLAALGLLGATLTASGAATATWTVSATGPTVEQNLGLLLEPIGGHPLAAAAGAVLQCIALAATATATADVTADAGFAPLVVGLDGTFRTGVLAGAVPGATEVVSRRPATHVGAKRRRDAALAAADALDAEADALEAGATALEAEAGEHRAAAAATMAALDRFPRRDRLRDAESARVAASEASALADAAAAEAEARAMSEAARATAERERWSTTVSAAGLPADFDALKQLIATADASIATLRDAGSTLGGKLRRRLRAFVDTVASHDTSAELSLLHDAAVAAHLEAVGLRAELDELQAQVGRSAQESVRRHAEVKGRLGALGAEVAAANKAAREAAVAAGALEVAVASAAANLAEADPVAAQRMAELRTLLALPGVGEALLGASPDADDRRLLDQVGAALDGKQTSARRTLRNLADETRATLAGVWSIDAGAEHALLETYLLTHGNDAFGPVDAAAHAVVLAQRAEEALHAADDAALQDFVIGRLPAAISQAWTRLFDWSDEVNAKMRSAAASSGVGVAVRISVRDDLSPAARVVYERACKTRDALRDPDAKAEAGRAIHQLINAADGDDMAARVRSAVNVRDWVDVAYQVTRPGEAPRNWGLRTGLSGGERRLVVLAPMLAAVAAAFDKFPAEAARLVALDEIPSEVDEEGREGLARYIAELDLDLVATSHHWDGAPGAWDGIDAHDLEAADDGTVVAFPILIRGASALPGEVLNGHAVPPV